MINITGLTGENEQYNGSYKMDEPKENKCEIRFYCDRRNFNPESNCVYFKPSEKDLQCKFFDAYMFCNSAVAQVNKMVLMLQEAGIKLKDK